MKPRDYSSRGATEWPSINMPDSSKWVHKGSLSASGQSSISTKAFVSNFRNSTIRPLTV